LAAAYGITAIAVKAIDSPYLDFSSNGLVVASNAFRGQPMAASVFMDISERSELSRIAGELL